MVALSLYSQYLVYRRAKRRARQASQITPGAAPKPLALAFAYAAARLGAGLEGTSCGGDDEPWGVDY